MSTYIKVEVTKIYTVEINDNSLTEQERLNMAVFRVFDEIDKFELHPNRLTPEEYRPAETPDIDKSNYTPLAINPKDYYGCIRPIAASD